MLALISVDSGLHGQLLKVAKTNLNQEEPGPGIVKRRNENFHFLKC
jgi:hypothetical protein